MAISTRRASNRDRRAAVTQLKLGDMFDGPSDLIVLPCSTSGTITPFVRQRLIHYRIPYPNPGKILGDVTVMPFDGGENIAQYVAYATSVSANASSSDAIRRIGSQLGRATQEYPTIRLVSAPLLGAGAGGLESEVVVEALSGGFKETAHNDARLLIHVLHEGVFERLSRPDLESRAVAAKSRPGERSVRVFVSYCHTSPKHEEWVEALATFLRKSGIDARMDVWHLRRGMDLPQFMTNELALADRVVLVSDERYAEKADGRIGGVGWETMIVQGDMANLPPDSTKYLVVVRSKKVDDGLPRYLKTKFVIHWPSAAFDQRNRSIILKELFNLVEIPEIGQRPVSV
jgi:hypothetical protein